MDYNRSHVVLRTASLHYCAFDASCKNAITSCFRCRELWYSSFVRRFPRVSILFVRSLKNSYTSYLITPLGAYKGWRENFEIAESITTLRFGTLIKMSMKFLSSWPLHIFLYNTQEKRDCCFLHVYLPLLRKNQFAIRSKNTQSKGHSR